METGIEEGPDIKLRIIPVGPVEPGIIEILKRDIGQALPADVRSGDVIEPPREAFDAGRAQYSAEAILNALAEQEADPREHVLGVIDFDLYIPDLTFVFGAALGRAALVSITRLRQEFYGLDADRGLFTRRVLTEAVHEAVHSYRMKHCFDPGCVMSFSRTIDDTDKKGFELCDSCRATLSRLSKPLLEISEDDPRLAPSLNIML